MKPVPETIRQEAALRYGVEPAALTFLSGSAGQSACRYPPFRHSPAAWHMPWAR